MNSRFVLIAGVVFMVVVAAAGVWVAGPLADRSGSGPAASPLARSGDLLHGEFLPLMEQVNADARALVTMGEARERNLLRIRGGQEAMTASLAAADAWLTEHPPEPDENRAVAAYRRGAAAIREAMAEAQAGFLRFDFARVGRATEWMREGTEEIEEAISLLQR